MGNIEKYGVAGDAMYSVWKYEYEEIRKGVKYGTITDEKPYRRLQLKLVAELGKQIELRNKVKKALTGGVVFSICYLVFVALTKLGFEINPILGLALMVLPILIPSLLLKSVNKKLDAVIDFDKEFFDGQIVYSLQHDIEL